MVGPIVARDDIDGMLKVGNTTFKAHYDKNSGQLILETVEAQSEQSPGGRGGRGEVEEPQQEETTVPQDFESLKISIERVLRHNRQTKLVHNQLKGKLDLKSKSLVKSQSGSKMVNVHKGKAGALGYNIILLVDNSGSMQQERKIELANKVTSGVHACLRNTDGINVKVLAFTDTMIEKASWTGKKVEEMYAGGGNADAAACYVSITEGFRDTPNPEYRNVLLVLSDGSPCEGRLNRSDLPKLDVFSSSSNAHIAQFVNRIARRERVYVAGLGIQNDSTQIPNSKKIDDLKDVQRALITVLKGAIDHE
jgi:Mg-chelatase subunit ChlD